MSNTLTVKIKRAKNLADKDGIFSGHSDPYVRVRIVDDYDHTQEIATQRTKIKSNTANPVWDETFTFPDLQEPGTYTLKLNVLDKDYLNRDDPLGEAVIDLGKLTDVQQFQDYDDVWIDGWVFKAYLSFSVSTHGRWGNSEEPASHTLRVMIKNATGLRESDNWFGGKTDPYVYMTITDAEGRKVAGPKQTSVKQDEGGNPEWNEELVFDEGIPHPSACRLKLVVYDKDRGTRDDKLGEATVHLGMLKNSQEDRDFRLNTGKGGKLNFTLNNMGTFGHSKPATAIEGNGGWCLCQ
mmetsp:Transcript_54407/g.150936  ORF Transcript_54407/g.150936 Transcript_54407/m.150936 type:complete len:295 (-) Transcript_54407:94-978(-)|eukprot:CAMPEP_0179076334 /NCGR_PEP_ID=MMETSP0796-20121207/34049_1 /TAXON_ID=73915 /ORGANISM="Pyrodinium bahamense, Strain pbaha01" /LENGTH=294 /DNA_ID=CAMNT_0020773587 /DNA_START=54 /DNA_END=938 /DNA_ORIENTATION=+